MFLIRLKLESIHKILNKLKSLRIKKFLIWAISIFIIIQLVIFIFRNPIANHFVQKKAAEYAKIHNAEVHIGRLKFKGLSGIEVGDIFVKANGKDTLLKIESTYVRLSFFNMLIFRVNITDFTLDGTKLNIIRDSLGDNYSNFLGEAENQEADNGDTTAYSYAEQAADLLDLAFDLLPSNITIKEFRINTNMRGHKLAMYLDKFEVDDHKFVSVVEVNEANIKDFWKFEGILDPGDRRIEGRWTSNDTSSVVIPYLNYKFATKLSFDTLRFNFMEENYSSTQTTLAGSASINGLTINNPRIALKDVFLNNASFDYHLLINENSIELDSSTTVIFNELKFNPYISYSRNPSKTIKLKVNKPWFEAQTFFNSLPEGLFSNLDGIKAQGELSYVLDVEVDFNNLDSLKFHSNVKKRNFKITDFGNSELMKINGSFVYTAYERGEPVRSFEVGASNPNFRTITQIPQLLVNVILYTEDMGFFGHNGFSESAFRSAMITNLKSRRFARGGSTISQQLVKNVFLNRNKTVIRKVEEVIIVWLIESNRLASKQRMMEVYLNIIEWGPMIYGANEASQFYFGKDISKITFAEAVYMASIIPKPKWFRGSFDGQGNLKPYMAGYYENVSGRMLKNGLISQEEHDNLKPQVVLSGPAKNFLIMTDSLSPDSLILME